MRVIFCIFCSLKGSLALTNFVSFSVSPSLVDLLIEKESLQKRTNTKSDSKKRSKSIGENIKEVEER